VAKLHEKTNRYTNQSLDQNQDDEFILETRSLMRDFGQMRAVDNAFLRRSRIDARLNDWDSLSGSRCLRRRNPWQAIAEFVNITLVITELEVRKLRHDPTDLNDDALIFCQQCYLPH